MEIVGAMDLHRSQITFKWQEMETGEVKRGRIVPAARQPVREWMRHFHGRDTHIALEATTGWRFVVEEMKVAGVTAHLAEPADTSALRGPKRRAKTDDRDCDHMVDLLVHGRLPEASCVGRWLSSTNTSSLLRGLFSWTSAREVGPYRWFSVTML